jgi:hypothetical protein
VDLLQSRYKEYNNNTVRRDSEWIYGKALTAGLCVVDKILCILNRGNYYTIGYADDIAIVINGKSLQTLSEVLYTALSMVQQWCDKTHFFNNPNKTAITPFSRNRDISGYKNQLSLVKR